MLHHYEQQRSMLSSLCICKGECTLTCPLLGRAGLLVAASADALSVAEDSLADEGLKSCLAALEGFWGFCPS